MNDTSTVTNFIGGEYCEPRSGNWLDNIDPARGVVAGRVANSGRDDIEAAVTAAESAFARWSQLPMARRALVLNRIADGIESRLDELAAAECLDGGKPITRAKTIEIPRAASNFRYYAAAATQFSSEFHDSIGHSAINYTVRQPLGAVACISPWNLPLYLLTWKVAPAMAMGNCVIAKPSELTPRTAYLLGEICNEAGLPAGVLNIVHGEGASAGQAILEHQRIKAVSFTGGSETGKHVASVVAPQLRKFSLELGGKNPNLIFADCDYQKALQTSVFTAFANQGQICLCGSRILIEQSIYETFKQDFIERTKQLVLGDPGLESTQIGALVSKPHFEKVCEYLELARSGEGGAKVLCGGRPATVDGFEQGYFVEPTIIEVATNQCRLNQEEIFGPIVTLMPFTDEQHAIELANDVSFGLSATVWSNQNDRVMRVSRAVDAGVVWVNTWLMRDLRTPFGGMKSSGVGREGGVDSLRFFTEPKNVCISY
ncbi:MAG: aldehyde dehydrogenase [Planctomycetota bacterium]